MDAEIATLRESIATSKANEKLIRPSLVSVNATMSSEELCNTVAQLEHEKKEMLARLGPLRAGNVKPVLREEKEAVQKEWREWSKKAGARKKICMELWEMCTEVIEEGKTKKELWVCRVLGSEERYQVANGSCCRRNGDWRAMDRLADILGWNVRVMERTKWHFVLFQRQEHINYSSRRHGLGA